MEQNFIDKEAALRIMASRVLITKPGKYHVKVNNNVRFLAETGKVFKELPGNNPQISIINFTAFTPYHLKLFKAYMKEGNYNEAVKKTNLTASVRSKDYIPSKNEIIAINVDFVLTKTGEQALLVTSYNEIPVSQAIKLTIENIQKDEEKEERPIIEFAEHE